MRRWLKDNRGFLVFLLCFAFFRTAIADWNPIPSASMRPTLLEGDVVLVDRLAYDAKLPLTNLVLDRRADPQRGDVVTFESPKDGTRLIKRIVAVPGDRVELRDDVLFVNGERARYRSLRQVRETLAAGVDVDAVRATETLAGSQREVQFLPGLPARRAFGPLQLGADQFFMLGDNRDNSGDSRFIGPVPRALIIGRAHRVLVSADITGNWMPRLARWAAPIR